MNEEMPPPTRTVPAATSGITKLALIALGMFAMGFVISRFVPPPEYYREKLAYFETHKDEFDLVFFGASDAHWGISSEIFDDQLKSHGINLRSFNLAVPGSNGYELHHMVRHVMSLDPAKLRYVLIVWRPWRLERQAHTHHRQTWWHSFDVTWLLFEGILMEKEQSLWEKVKSIQAHGRDFFRKILNLGLGPDMIAYWRDPPAPGKGKWDYLAKTGGYEALGPETADRFWPEGAKMREIFLNEQDLFIERTLEDGKRLAELRTREREPGDPYMATLYPRSTAATASQVRILQQNSIEPVYLVPPSHEDDVVQRRLHVEGYIPNLMTFNDPGEYPDLFKLEYRYDHLHLTEEGSALYSRYVADRFAELMKSGKIPPPNAD